MNESRTWPTLSGGQPLTDPADDRLGYAGFAAALAKSIMSMMPPEGLVLAIYAPWGAGKSSVLEFICAYLDEQHDEEGPVIVRFNPWWFSGQEDLTRRFFDQLEAVLKKKGLFDDATRNKIADLGNAVASIPFAELLPGGALVKAGVRVATTLIRPDGSDVVALKAEIADALSKCNRRILVIIDDIDRLTAEEIRQIFRLIKAVADFPNVVYILAFDKAVAISALSASQGVPGAAYLEKIVQVPFELPEPDRTALRLMLEESIQVVIRDIHETTLDHSYWQQVYSGGIDAFIQTPRDVVRLVNTISVTYPAIQGEVNIVDLFAIEAVRVFCPDL